MRNLIVVLILLSQTCFGQSEPDTLRILAQQIGKGEGSKIHIAKYKVLKVLEGNLDASNILVGYKGEQELNYSTEPVLLTLLKYEGKTTIKDYYHYPNYNALEGVEKVNLLRINRGYWESCEKGACAPLILYMDYNVKRTFLLLPCGGTVTEISLSKENGKSLNGTWWAKDCPPMFDITGWGIGEYNAYMLACGLGGGVTFSVKKK